MSTSETAGTSEAASAGLLPGAEASGRGARAALRTQTRMTLIHARYQLLRTLRIPIALVGTAFFPGASMLFFVVPAVGDDPVGSTYATTAMIVFATMTSNLFGHGIGVAEERQQPWDLYTRTLPSGPGPKFSGRLLAGLGTMLLSLIPLLAIAAFATEATTTPLGFLAGVAVVVLVSIPFTLMGLTIGYLLPVRAAMAVVQLTFFPLAFAGGLFSGPDRAPGFIETIAPFTPTRGAAELMWAAVGDYHMNPVTAVAFAVWTVLLAVLSVYAYRRDEGQRFH
ncbi:ABC transporter permease [Streptomyces sp. NPDC056194]|uniref:ABC transporter permease n=1 Tax=unclassified Streptomyces TaxID=2593676 RepID=UPI0035D74971